MIQKLKIANHLFPQVKSRTIAINLPAEVVLFTRDEIRRVLAKPKIEKPLDSPKSLLKP